MDKFHLKDFETKLIINLYKECYDSESIFINLMKFSLFLRHKLEGKER